MPSQILSLSRRLPLRSWTVVAGAILAQGLSIALPATAPQLEQVMRRTLTQTPPAVTTPSNIPVQKKPARVRQAIKVVQRTVNEVPLYQTTIDLTDPDTFLTLGLANQAPEANSAVRTYGNESFDALVDRAHASVVVNGTFFSKDEQQRVMGNMVAAGKFLKYRPWENYGTTLGLRPGNRPEMVTTRAEGKPKWENHWFSLTAGPRLLRQGKIWLKPRLEGFRDEAVLGSATRSAIGFTRGGSKLVLVTFLAELTLEEEAQLMKDLGCYEAMNLDGGSSLAFAKSGHIWLDAGRPLTNVIIAYDHKHPAPKALKESWRRFQAGDRPKKPKV